MLLCTSAILKQGPKNVNTRTKTRWSYFFALSALLGVFPTAGFAQYQYP
jgi:hypothetical protein